jgi:hypothetical protein
MKQLIVSTALWLTAVLCACAETKGVQAPVGVPKDAKPFEGKWYRVYTEKTSWRNAKTRCERVGGHLAVVPNEATQHFVESLAQGLTLWLGANDEKVEGQWVWEDGSKMGFKAWLKGQPSNTGSKERWLAMWNGRRWADLEDNAPQVVGYVCEWTVK